MMKNKKIQPKKRRRREVRIYHFYVKYFKGKKKKGPALEPGVVWDKRE